MSDAEIRAAIVAECPGEDYGGDEPKNLDELVVAVKRLQDNNGWEGKEAVKFVIEIYWCGAADFGA